MLLRFFVKTTSGKRSKYYTWGLGAGSVPSVSGPAPVTSWTLAPMPFSARGGAVEMTGQTPTSDNIITEASLPKSLAFTTNL